MYWLFLLALPLVYLYIRENDRKLAALPPVAAAFSPHRVQAQDIEALKKSLAENPVSISEIDLGPKTGRRYIVVGGGGFLGGWIVAHLIQRGEMPDRIRILDIRPPKREDLVAQDISFFSVDIRNSQAVADAFNAPWPATANDAPLTVFHTAANIRFFERHLFFLHRSLDVNVNGTQNLLDAARSAGATTFIYTSSGAVAVQNTRFLLWPWESEPKSFVQIIDDQTVCEKPHTSFFSNYAVSKWNAEQRVLAANLLKNSNETVMRTGAIRPGNGVFGPHGDMMAEAYLVRKSNPSGNHSILNSFAYVENSSQAHLCYEQRLNDLAAGSQNPDISGQAFNICDSGPPATYGDMFGTLSHLDSGKTTFPTFSTTLLLSISHVLEAYYCLQYLLMRSGFYFATFLPPVSGEIVNLQPSMFSLTTVHLIFDDSRARLPVEQGGLGYTAPWTTLQGFHKTANEYHAGLVGKSADRAQMAGLNFGFLFRKRKAGGVSSSPAAPMLNRVDTPKD